MNLDLFKGPNRVGVSLPSSEDEYRSSFRNVVFPSLLEFQTINKVLKKKVNFSIVFDIYLGSVTPISKGNATTRYSKKNDIFISYLNESIIQF
jgi:hypothetical protein